MKPWSLALALLVCAHLALALGMAAHHGWHEWVHSEAEHDDHECVVKLLVYGGCAAASLEMPLAALLQPPAEMAPALVSADVPAVFLARGILEHAPPRRA